MGKGMDKLWELEKEMQTDVNPEKMLRLLFNLINFKKANVDIYFLLHKSKRPLTINDLCENLPYSERTIRTYIGMLTDRQYVEKVPTIRERPCFAYRSIKPQQVWALMLEEMRKIKREAMRSFGTA
ncbi:MAG: hypothetical protein ABIF92_00600 [archaeon]